MSWLYNRTFSGKYKTPFVRITNDSPLLVLAKQLADRGWPRWRIVQELRRMNPDAPHERLAGMAQKQRPADWGTLPRRHAGAKAL